MEQAHKSEIIDKTTAEAEVDMDASGENLVLKDAGLTFDLGDFSCGLPAGSGSSTAASATGGWLG